VSAIAQPIPQATLANRVGRRARDWVPAVAVFALGIVAWQWLFPDVFHVERFLLPRFSAVMSTFWHKRSELWGAGWFTFKEALGGFALGCSVALAVALVLSRWRRLGQALMPAAIAANAIPIIAFAPITNAWFGLLSPWSKIVIAAVLCFFPVLVNTLRGLTSVPSESIELMRSYAASERAIYRRLRIPTSLPFLFSALKIGCVLAMIGAVVGDYFGGSTKALGVQIQSSVSLSQFETAWSAILVASILGIAFYATIAIAERLALSWHPSTRGATE
jgi:NitT/TauT family transport system permease protein